MKNWGNDGKFKNGLIKICKSALTGHNLSYNLLYFFPVHIIQVVNILYKQVAVVKAKQIPGTRKIKFPLFVGQKQLVVQTGFVLIHTKFDPDRYTEGTSQLTVNLLKGKGRMYKSGSYLTTWVFPCVATVLSILVLEVWGLMSISFLASLTSPY